MIAVGDHSRGTPRTAPAERQVPPLAATNTAVSQSVSLNLSSGGRQILVSGFLFLTLPFSGYLDAAHHWYSALAGIAGACGCHREKKCGSNGMGRHALGLATGFSQSMVLAVAEEMTVKAFHGGFRGVQSRPS